MSRWQSVKAGNVVLGDGIPKICVPIVAKNEEQVLTQARQISALPADLVEWRLDWLEDPFSASKFLPSLRQVLGDRPILLTFRTKEEGGEQAITASDYVALYEDLMSLGLAQLIDVEYERGEQTVRTLVEAARKAGVLTVLSHHNFDRTPAAEEMLQKLVRMQKANADITKLAVMPHDSEDVTRLLSVSTAMKERYADRPYITMSMGKLGLVSRISGELTGSAVTFGSASAASAPGQLPVGELRTILSLLAGKKKKKPNIYLIGFMGCGKSTISHALGSNTRMREMEMDEEIVRMENRPIADIFAQDGEDYFRGVETALLKLIADTGGYLVSCGGGVPMRQENVHLMKESGYTVLLTASPAEILSRVKDSEERPILNGHMNEAYIAELMEKRRPFYEAAADVVVCTDGRQVDDICREILQKLTEKEVQ